MPTLWRYVCAQVAGEEGMSAAQGAEKGARVRSFVHVPLRLERLLLVGMLVCLDAMLHVLAVLPVRACAAVASALVMIATGRVRRGLRRVLRSPSIAQVVSLALAVSALHRHVDASQLYHMVRGQSVIKLYVIFNMLEVFDKLWASFGLDVLEAVLGGDRAPLLAALLPVYLALHAAVLLLQLVTLNVAVNSPSNALLTLLVSNQFVEVKSAVFKRFERENLFQLACGDVVERFQLALYIALLAARNATAAGTDAQEVLATLAVPLALIYASEIAVDWTKHAFITKFNAIEPEVYVRFVERLARDFAKPPVPGTAAEAQTAQYPNAAKQAPQVFISADNGRRTFEDAPHSGEAWRGECTDPSPAAARRIGFAALPLSCLALHVALQACRSLEVPPRTTAAWAMSSLAVLFLSKLVLGRVLWRYMRSCTRC